MNVTATLFGQFLTFFVLVWFVMTFLWGPILKALEDRRTKIADGLAAAQAGLEQHDVAKREVQTLLREAREQAKGIVVQAEKRGEEIVEKARSDARTEGHRQIAAAQAEIEQQVTQAREQLREEVAAIALAGAEQVLMREVDQSTHSEALGKLAARL